MTVRLPGRAFDPRFGTFGGSGYEQDAEETIILYQRKTLKNKIMKKLFVMTVVALLTLSAASAQPSGPREARKGERQTPEQIAERRTENMGKCLSLTAEQRKEIYRLNLDEAKKMRSEMDKAEKKRDKAYSKANSQREKYAAKLKKVLTAEQYAAFEKRQGDHHRRGDMRNYGEKCDRMGHPRHGEKCEQMEHRHHGEGGAHVGHSHHGGRPGADGRRHDMHRGDDAPRKVQPGERAGSVNPNRR